MTDERKPRQRRTDADRVHELAQKRDAAKKRWYDACNKYDAALKAAHERANAAAASLPPLAKQPGE